MSIISQFIIEQEKELKAALKVINENAHGICFVTGPEGRLVGVLTDGDIRRALIDSKPLNSAISEIMETSFMSLPINSSQEKILSSLNNRVKIIPLVDESFKPVDYASFSRLHRTPVMQPLLDGNELSYVSECIKTGWISSQGAYVKQFENEFAKFCSATYPVAVSNGTVALHLALVALGIGEGDEVIVPNLTFAASINSVIYAGAIPILVDIDRTTWTISCEEIRKNITKKTKAIMPVHLYGHPCHMDEIMEIANEHKLLIIEDAAEAIGSKYKGRHVGSFGDAATFSFFGNKTITTGEGGMVFFKDKSVYEKAVVLRDHGMSKEKKYWHDMVGFNYRMTNLQAAIGCAQLERISYFVNVKRELAKRYNEILLELKTIELPPEEKWAECGFWLYTALVKDKSYISRDELIHKLLKNGIESRPVFYPLSEMPPYVEYAGDRNFENSTYISRNGISFPSYVNISKEEIENIVASLKRIFSPFAVN